MNREDFNGQIIMDSARFVITPWYLKRYTLHFTIGQKNSYHYRYSSPQHSQYVLKGYLPQEDSHRLFSGALVLRPH